MELTFSMRILLISYFFPPDKSVGGFRASSFTKYFIDKDIKVDLLTSNPTAGSKEVKEMYNIDNVFIAKRPKLREWGYKTKILALLELLKLDSLFFFPDVYFPWIKRGIKVGNFALKKNHYDAILTTAPPFSTFFIGYKLSQFFGIPLILDYRDPWNDQPFNKIPWKFIENRHKKWERKIASSAELIVTVGEKCAQMIATSAKLDPMRIKIIQNGFFIERELSSIPEKSSNTFVFGYFGNMYLLRRKCFEAFLGGLALFIREHQLSPEEVNIVYAGGTSRKMINRILKKTGTSFYFKDLGLLTREETYKQIQKSHVSLLFIPEKVEYALPTKIFDYMSNYTHVFIIGNEGEASNLCKEVEQKFSISPCDEESIKKKLEELYLQWKQGKLEYGCNTNLLKKFERKNLAHKYAEIIKEGIRKKD